MNKKKYQVSGLAINRSDTIVNYTFVGYTHAVSPEQARKNIEYREKLFIRCPEIKEVVSAEPKQMSIYDIL